MRLDFRRELGGGMIYFLMTSAFLGVVIVGLQRLGQQDLSKIKIERVKTQRESIMKRINGLNQNAKALNYSAAYAGANNQVLSQCLTSSCVPMGPLEFSLYDPDASTSLPLSGGTVYDEQGNRCPAGSSTCMFEVRTYFSVSCVNSPCTSTDPSSSIRTSTTVRVLPLGANLPSIADMKNATNPNVVSLSAIRSSAQDCPAGSALGQIDKNGVASCKCLNAPSITATKSSDCPVLAGSCPSGVFVGLQMINNQVVPKCLSYTEIRVDQIIPEDDMSMQCPMGPAGQPYRLCGLSDPSARCATIGSDPTLHCEQMVVRCCLPQ